MHYSNYAPLFLWQFSCVQPSFFLLFPVSVCCLNASLRRLHLSEYAACNSSLVMNGLTKTLHLVARLLDCRNQSARPIIFWACLVVSTVTKIDGLAFGFASPNRSQTTIDGSTSSSDVQRWRTSSISVNPCSTTRPLTTNDLARLSWSSLFGKNPEVTTASPTVSDWRDVSLPLSGTSSELPTFDEQVTGS